MDEKIKKCCPNCSQMYQWKQGSQPKANIPLFLSCGHSVCESCIRNLVKFEEPIQCKICHVDMELYAKDVALLSINKNLLYELFPVNLCMLGELTFQYMEQSQTGKKKDDSCFIDLQAILKSTDSTTGQCLECHSQTSKMCRQCNTILCETCFNKSHKNFVIFQNHVLQNIEPIAEPNKCRLHKGKPLDYYCNDCSKSICMDCLMVGGEKSCKNHNVMSMDEVNESFMGDLCDIVPKVDETFRRLTKTAVDIGHLLHNIENESGSSSELTQILAKIEQHFSKLSFFVQKHKKEVIDIIVKLKCSERESLLKAKDNVANYIKKAKTTMNAMNLCSNPKKAKEVNLAVLLDDAKRIAETPWYLKRDESNDPLKVAVNEDLCSLISDYIHLDGNANSVYKLRPVSELPEGVELPPPPTAPVFPPELPKDVRQMKESKAERSYARGPAPMFFKDVPKYRSKSGSVSSLNSADSESSYMGSITVYGDGYQRPMVQQVQPFADSQHPKQLREGSQELIYISHIVDPHNFFVQRACHQGMVKEMLREFRNAACLPKPAMSHVAEGKTYLVFNKADNMWQRCRVVSIDRRNINNPTFQVFCIDFGSLEVVNIDKLRLLPPARVQSPYPLAINCSLANCKPKTGTWSSDDAYLIHNIIDNKQAIIHVRRVRAPSNCAVTLECDVTTFDEGISLAHALVFHERATMPHPKLPYPKIAGATEIPKLFVNTNDFKPKTVEEVLITNITSPDKFYVRKCHLGRVYEKLCEDLEIEYSLNNNNGSVYLPQVGMVCVVNVEKYRPAGEEGARWARAIVSELPGRGRALLRLPDCGASILAHWRALRHIHHKFTTQAQLATECHLAGVTPLNKSWSQKSVALLQRFQDRPLELHVEDRRRGSVGVTLYDRADEDDVVCVNTEMIKHKFAVTFGLFMFNKTPVVEDLVITNKSPLDVPIVPTPRAKKTILHRPKQGKQVAEKVKENELEAKDKGPLRLEAKVLHYQSPSLLYVSLVHQQKVFNELYEKMQKYYAKKKAQGKSDWVLGDRCCMLCNQSQTWRRAIIVELEADNAKVFYSDFACVETVPVASLRELTPDFTSIGDAAIKCHLCGVVSADGEDWPTITKEYLKELLDAYPRVFITKLGNFKDKSMPVELWVYHTMQGGALEPNTSEWRCLNKKIIEQGLGVPDKTQQLLGTENSSDTKDDDMLSFLKNVTGSVQDYLQLEPMPTKPLVAEPTSPTSGRSSPALYEDASNVSADTSNTVFISDWLPAEPLPAEEFIGMPTYIDNDGVIYLHDVTQQDTLDFIRKALDARFKAPDPKAKYAKWNVGEPCVALFFLDNRFYRGRIMEVNKDDSTCLVHYIDYGNEEQCTFENLRKSIALYQIPVQAHRCVLSRIRPAGDHWDRQSLDYLHKSVVEKKCFVKIVGEPINGIIPVDLKYDKLWINDHLVDFEMAKYTDGSKAIVRKFATTKASTALPVKPLIVESDSGPDYIVDDENDTTRDESFDMAAMAGKDWNKLLEEEENSIEGKYITYQKNNVQEFLCNITIINDLNKLALNLIQDDETVALYAEMYDTIQQEGENMSPIDGVFENKACIALFSEDGQWYRASILEYSESDNRIKVRFVDYGNVDIVSLSEVREIDEEWTRLPPATVTATLHGVRANPQLDVAFISQEYGKTFLDKGPFHAQILGDSDSLPSVELRNDDGELVYENLIQNNIFLKYDTTDSLLKLARD